MQAGTIPSKALREVAYQLSRSGGMRQPSLRTAYPLRLAGRRGAAQGRRDCAAGVVLLQRILRHGVALIPGEASFVDAHTLQVVDAAGKTRNFSAEVIILASGSRPRRHAAIPFDKKTVLDSTSILNLRQMPNSLLVVGGGVIACEFVSIFAALGTQVCVVDSHAQLLEYLSEDMVEVLADSFLGMGVTFHMKERVKEIRREETGTVTVLESGKRSAPMSYSLRRAVSPIAKASKLPTRASISQDGWITVDQHFQTSVPHIFAVGDLIGRPALASTGMEQGRAAVLYAFGGGKQEMAENLPMAVYTIPEISYVGKTEKEVQKDGRGE